METKEIVKAIASITKTYPIYDVFCDLIECLAISYENLGGFIKGPNYEENEKRFQTIRKKYKAKELEKMMGVYSLLIAYAERHSITDIMGNVFEESQLSNKATSQFFTPKQVSSLNGELVREKVIKGIKQKGYAVIQDETCGAGGNLLAVANWILRRGYNPQRQLIIIASDIDNRCCNMAFVQFSIYGLPAAVIQKDVLANKVNRKMKTPAFVLNGWNWLLRSERR